LAASAPDSLTAVCPAEKRGREEREHKTNEEILQMVETEREIMDTVRSQQEMARSHPET